MKAYREYYKDSRSWAEKTARPIHELIKCVKHNQFITVEEKRKLVKYHNANRLKKSKRRK
jgi:hypothetical protein